MLCRRCSICSKKRRNQACAPCSDTGPRIFIYHGVVGLGAGVCKRLAARPVQEFFRFRPSR